MANRHNHYEAAFEAFIRTLRVPCVAVDEAKRSFFGDEGLKNPDFLLYPRLGPNLVVEVKGKKGKDVRGRRPWENWVTTDDLDGLARWQEMFGPGFRAILAFAYAEPLPLVPAAPRRRRVRVPRPVVPVLGGRARRLRPAPPLAGTGVEGRRDGPRRVPPQGPPAARMAADDRRRPEAAEAPQGPPPMTRLARSLRAVAVLAALALPAAARGQAPDPNAPAATDEGNPVPGYVATGMLGAAALFVLCKSARR